MKNGDMVARDKIINHNIRLVINEVIKKFPNSPYDVKELVSIGLIGLIKSVDTFDITKGLQFATYSTRCINNEILMFMRKGKKYINDTSLEQPLGTDKEEKELKVEDTLSASDSDFVLEYENNESYKVIRNVVNSLPERDKNVIIKHFGFKNNNPMTQREIADELGLSQSYVSRIIKKVLKDISMQLKVLGIIEVSFNPKNKNKEKSVKGAKKMAKKLQTIYEYFNKYSREQIDEMLTKLTEEEKELISLRYGSDLDNPITSEKWDKEKTDQYYGSLLPKMKKLLANPDYVFRNKKSKAKVNSSQKLSPIKDKQAKIISQYQSGQNNNIKYSSKSTTQENNEKSTLVKEDYIRIMELLKTSNFGKMLNILTPKEAIIVCLRLGYVDDKYFSSNSIAEFLGIESSEVIETTKKVLLLYKDSINEFIDKAVDYTSDNQNSNNLIRKKNN